MRSVPVARNYHYGQKNRLELAAKQQLAEAFCPQDSAWRGAILDLGRKLFKAFV